MASSTLQALIADSIEALGADGTLAQRQSAFTTRPSQQRLAAAIAQTLVDRDILLAEAGTGTGKTYAYLVPVLLSGQKVIISTGTRALQDQLFHRDLPHVRDALRSGATAALLKGRANYLCRYRLEQTRGDPQAVRGLFATPAEATQFQRIVEWSGRTRYGDMAELEQLDEQSMLLPKVTSTAENCLGNECPFWGDCFVVQARQRAQAADIVVVNHHLLLADLALKQEGFGEILPGAQAFVVDEAHQLPELAAQFFGEGIGARVLVDLARDALGEARAVPSALAQVQAPAQALEQAVRAAREAMGGLPVRGTQRRACGVAGVDAALQVVADAATALRDALSPLREAAPGLDACHLRAQEHAGRLQHWLAPDPRGAGDADDERGWGDADAFDERPPAADDVRWYELSPRGFRLQRTPLDVSGPLREHRERSHAAWIFTSATLAVDGGFAHVQQRLGIDDAQTLIEPSPFDWPRQALCFLPPRLPEPADRDFTASMLAAVRPLLTASNGRAFLLFASHRALREAADALADGPWPLFVQGTAPRHVLLERFRASGNGVLLGAASFREGVDVAGDALSVVVIDKLPFASPDDPVFQARLDAVARGGGNPFRDEQIPQAVIALKQGAGRLIRGETDRGVLVLCDPRLTQKSYGRIFLDSLPPLPRTRDIADAVAFFTAECASSNTGSST